MFHPASSPRVPLASPAFPLLRLALLADAGASGAMGVLLAAGGAALAPWLGLPSALLVGAGLVLLPFAVFVAFVGTRPAVPRWAAWTVVAVNLLWVGESLLLLALPSVSPTGLGVAFVLAQAGAVLALALAQIVGLRRTANGALPA